MRGGLHDRIRTDKNKMCLIFTMHHACRCCSLASGALRTPKAVQIEIYHQATLASAGAGDYWSSSDIHIKTLHGLASPGVRLCKGEEPEWEHMYEHEDVNSENATFIRFVIMYNT